MFSLCIADMFSDTNAIRPDIVIADESIKNGFILKGGCCFDLCPEEAYLTKLVKYQSLVQQISGSGYK